MSVSLAIKQFMLPFAPHRPSWTRPVVIVSGELAVKMMMSYIEMNPSDRKELQKQLLTRYGCSLGIHITNDSRLILYAPEAVHLLQLASGESDLILALFQRSDLTEQQSAIVKVACAIHAGEMKDHPSMHYTELEKALQTTYLFLYKNKDPLLATI